MILTEVFRNFLRETHLAKPCPLLSCPRGKRNELTDWWIPESKMGMLVSDIFKLLLHQCLLKERYTKVSFLICTGNSTCSLWSLSKLVVKYWKLKELNWVLYPTLCSWCFYFSCLSFKYIQIMGSKNKIYYWLVL